METAQAILVIILSATLAILLVLSIVVASLTIKILQQIRRITDRAEHVVETAEHVGQAFSNVTGPLSLLKLVRNVVDMAAKSRTDKNNKHKGS